MYGFIISESLSSYNRSYNRNLNAEHFFAIVHVSVNKHCSDAFSLALVTYMKNKSSNVLCFNVQCKVVPDSVCQPRHAQANFMQMMRQLTALQHIMSRIRNFYNTFQKLYFLKNNTIKYQTLVVFRLHSQSLLPT